jgi:hypothetical protein
MISPLSSGFSLPRALDLLAARSSVIPTVDGGQSVDDMMRVKIALDYGDRDVVFGVVVA